MKYPEYDSPFELTISDITTQMARNIDEACWQAIQRIGIDVDKEKMLIALKQDAERYREAFSKGRDTGYAKRDEEIVRCKDCKNWIPGYITDQDDFIPPKCGKYQQMVGHSADDYCNLAERKEGR